MSAGPVTSGLVASVSENGNGAGGLDDEADNLKCPHWGPGRGWQYPGEGTGLVRSTLGYDLFPSQG